MSTTIAPKADPYDLYDAIVDGIVYRGTSNKATPDDSDIGYTMWTESIQEAAGYCTRDGTIWTLDLRDAPYIGAHIAEIKALILADYETGGLPYDMDDAIACGLDRGEALDDIAAAMAEEYNPRDIINSAEAYDNLAWVNWLYCRYIEPREITAVRTWDGGIAFDAAGAVDTGLTAW